MSDTFANQERVRAAYVAHGAELYRFALRGLGEPGAAQDAVQETFLRAWRARDRYDPMIAGLRVWLFGIARNVLIDMHRAAGARPWLRTVTDHEPWSGTRPRAGRMGVAHAAVPGRGRRCGAWARTIGLRSRRPTWPTGRTRGGGRARHPREHPAQPRVLRAQGAARRHGRDGGGVLMEEHDHQELRVLLGGYVLDQLAPVERRRLEAHLATCAECRAELDGLLPVASGLAAVRRADGVPPDLEVPVPPGLGDRVLASVDAEHRSERRHSWRRPALVAGVAAAAAAAVLVAGLALTRTDPPPAAAPVPLEKVAVTTDAPGADRLGRPGRPHLGRRGEAPGHRVRRGRPFSGDGARSGRTGGYPAGEFVGTGTKEMLCNLNSSVLRDRARGFVVRDATGTVVASSTFGT